MKPEFRKDSEVADWALSGAKPLGRPLKTWEREALRRKRRSLLQAAVEMENMAMSGTASPKMAAVRKKAARKHREQIADLEKVMARFKILETKTTKITKGQLRRIIQEEKASLLEQRSVEFEFVQAVDSLMAILKSLDPMERNSMIYDLVEELEDLASRG